MKKEIHDSMRSSPLISALAVRPGFTFVATIWLFSTLFIATLLAMDVARQFGWLQPNGVPIGRDFANVWIGGKLAISDGLATLYDWRAYQDFQKQTFDPIGGILERRYYSYPPHSLFLAAPFGALAHIPAFVLWTVATFGLFAWAARKFVPRNVPFLLAVASPATLMNIWSGQYGLLLGALWLLLFSAQSERSRGAFAALLTLKPHLGILLPVIFILRRWWTTIVLATAIATALILLSMAVFGPDLWRRYFAHLAETHGVFIQSTNGFLYEHMMVSPMGAFRWTGTPTALHLAFAAAALILFWRAKGVAIRDLALITSTATFLILPYSHSYDLTVLGLAAAILMFTRGLARWERAIVSLAYLCPITTLFATWAAPPTLLALLYVQVRQATMKAADPKNIEPLDSPIGQPA